MCQRMFMELRWRSCKEIGSSSLKLTNLVLIYHRDQVRDNHWGQRNLLAYLWAAIILLKSTVKAHNKIDSKILLPLETLLKESVWAASKDLQTTSLLEIISISEQMLRSKESHGPKTTALAPTQLLLRELSCLAQLNKLLAKSEHIHLLWALLRRIFKKWLIRTLNKCKLWLKQLSHL